jgi:hypothetical protein
MRLSSGSASILPFRPAAKPAPKVRTICYPFVTTIEMSGGSRFLVAMVKQQSRFSFSIEQMDAPRHARGSNPGTDMQILKVANQPHPMKLRLT